MTDEQKTQINEDALKYVLSLAQGRKVLWDILGLAGLYRQPRVPADTEGTAFNCGSLNVGLAIYADCLAIAPDLTAMMTKEQATYDNREPEPKPKPEPRSESATSSDSAGSLPDSLNLNRYTGRPFGDGSGN